MTRAAQDVIDRFKLLSPDEQTAAHIEIDEVWTTLPKEKWPAEPITQPH